MLFPKRIKIYLTCFLGCVLALASCIEEDAIAPSVQTVEINEFIWEHMNNIYLWKDNISQFIEPEREIDPKALFEKMLYEPTDRWSFITDDYQELVNSLKGIEKSFGHQFKLYFLPNSNNIAGIVKYVVPESPADLAGIKRGDLFYQVDGINLNSDNYRALLFESDSYALTFGEIDLDGKLVANDEIQLNAEVIAKNPILLHKTIDFGGSKIGYLSYNQFINDYNDELISVFKDFKNTGVKDLVLDLRYNPGGSINTAILLSSMIVPSNVSTNKEVYSKLIWNDEIMDYLLQKEGEESGNLTSRFVTPEVNLNLNRVFILISSNSASASELVINCLDPYMEVILVGSDNTSGKYVGSITVNDEDADHGWAMQPIVLKTANSNGISDYVDGFAPEYFVEDDFDAELGTLDEDMLARAVEIITGITIADPARTTSTNVQLLSKSLQTPYESSKQKMYFDYK